MAKPIHVSEKQLSTLLDQPTVADVKETPKKVRIVGNAVVLTSKVKFDTILKLEKYNKNALCLVETQKDGSEKEIFRIMTGKASAISKYGIVFAEKNTAGYAVATVLLPDRTENKKEYVKDNFGSILFMLNDLEAAIETIKTSLEAAYAKLDEEIVEE